ncbi:MAG: transporter substrate-binding domain-containing protein, partial [Okeania sp. SIO1H6]|nr:transporter substrate-binding domain-containing protein [Okeania sp. SIO1H6]
SEIYERHFPDQERNQNLLWSDGGLLYSPPFSGSEIDTSLNNNDNRNLLKRIKDRGYLKLGLPGNNPGFAVETENGEFAGFDVDLGKAIAAALFEDPSKLEVTVQSFKNSFGNTANGVVDVSAMGITHNLLRDATLGIDFSPTYLYTGQGVLVRSDSGINVLPALNGRRVGVLSGATTLQNLQDTFTELGGDIIPVEFATNDEMFAAYEAEQIDAVSTDLTILSARRDTLSNPDQHRILNDVLSKEPLGLITDENQSAWSDVVRWVTNALVQAEEYGITSENIDDIIAQNIDSNRDNDSDSEIREFLGIEGNIGKVLGLQNDFVVNIIKAVGNYGEIYERNFDSEVLRREENKLASNFGLQYAPPLGEEVSPQEQEELGSGDDVYEIQPSTLEDHPDGFQAGGGNDRVTGSIRSDSISGGQGEDTISGNDGEDVIAGGPGDDYLYGKDDDDILEGRPGNDRLFGGPGDDELKGGQGRDNLNGGPGNDILTGNASKDKFVFATNEEFDTEALGSDLITDFNPGHDMIVLDKDTFTTLESESGTGFSIETEFASVTNNAASSEALIVYNSNNGKLFYNQNGSEPGFGEGGEFAVLAGQPAISADDFLIR